MAGGFGGGDSVSEELVDDEESVSAGMERRFFLPKREMPKPRRFFLCLCLRRGVLSADSESYQ